VGASDHLGQGVEGDLDYLLTVCGQIEGEKITAKDGISVDAQIPRKGGNADLQGGGLLGLGLVG